MRKAVLAAAPLALLLALCLVRPSPAVEACGRTVSLRAGYGYGGYGYATQGYVQEQYVNPIVVVGVPVSNLGVPYYWSVGQELREEAVAKKAADLLRKGECAGEKGGAPGKSPERQSPGRPTAPDFDLLGPAAPPPAGESAPPGRLSKLDGQVLDIFKASCASCHKPGKTLGGVVLLDREGGLHREASALAELKRRQTVYDSVFGGDDVNLMPKNADPLPDDKVETIRAWLREARASE